MVRRNGYALVSTLFVLFAVGALVTVGFYRAAGSTAAEPSEHERVALAIAESGLRGALREWDAERLAAVPAHRDTSFVGWVTEDREGRGRGYMVNVARAGIREFVVTATGMDAGVGSATYCTVVVRTRLRSGRLVEPGNWLERTCHRNS
jgi:hypothetical protein